MIMENNAADKLVIGIDGGGTKSHLGLFDLKGNCMGVSVHGPLNHECMPGSFEQLEAELSQFINEALAGAGASVSDVVYGVFGLAGVDTRQQHEVIGRILENIGLSGFLLCNDAYLGVAAGCPGGTGICAINGTGSSMAAVDSAGSTVQVGGIGGISNDCGGSGWYGMRLLGRVYDELFKEAASTVMTEMVFERLGIEEKADYTESLTGSLAAERITLSDLNYLVFQAADKGDQAALKILEESADHYAGGITYLARNLDFSNDETIYVTYAGSIFVKEKIKLLPAMIEERVRTRLPERKVIFQCLDTVPVAGAVYWALQKSGVCADIGGIRSALAAAGL